MKSKLISVHTDGLAEKLTKLSDAQLCQAGAEFVLLCLDIVMDRVELVGETDQLIEVRSAILNEMERRGLR
jgi:hypothetical protein